MRTVAWDCVEYLMDYLGADFKGAIPRVIRRSLQAALRELPNTRNWTCFYQHGRLKMNGFYATGTVAIVAATGTVTLTGGTWPAWALYGTLRVGTLTYDIASVTSSTVLLLDPVLSAIADVPAGSPYTLYRDTYTLPEDFVATDRGFTDISWGGMEYVHPREWLQVTRYYSSSTNTPRFFTAMGDPKAPGRLCFRVFPYPDQDRTLDTIYHRKPRAVTIDKYETGTVSLAGATQTVTGNGTAFTAAMVGSTLRLSADGVNAPTNFDGSNPAIVEATITAVANGGSLTVDAPIAQAFTAVKYRISDPIDIEQGAMLEAFFRCLDKHASLQRNMKDRAAAEAAYNDALTRALEADSRNFSIRRAGQTNAYRQRLANMPRGPDIS